MTGPQPPAPVTQEDREAAADYMRVSRIGTEATYRRYSEGGADNSNIVQAFARHRLAHSPPEPTGDVKQQARELLADLLEFSAPVNAGWLRAGDEGAIAVYRHELDLLERALSSPPEPQPADREKIARAREALAEWEDYDPPGDKVLDLPARLGDQLATALRAILAAPSLAGDGVREALADACEALEGIEADNERVRPYEDIEACATEPDDWQARDLLHDRDKLRGVLRQCHAALAQPEAVQPRGDDAALIERLRDLAAAYDDADEDNGVSTMREAADRLAALSPPQPSEAVRDNLVRLLAVTKSLAGELVDPGPEALAAIHCAESVLSRPHASARNKALEEATRVARRYKTESDQDCLVFHAQAAEQIADEIEALKTKDAANG